MTSQQILQSDLLDILFEKRNKLYGAYQLRKEYPRQLIKAIAAALSTPFLLLYFLQPLPAKNSIMPIDDGVIVIHVDALPPETEKPVPPQVPQSEQAPVKQHTFIDNITIVQKDIGSEVSPITDLLNAAVSNSTTDGKNADVMQPLPPVERSSIGSAEKAAEEKPPTEVIPDKQPQFPGGIQAWQAFLSKHLHAPQDLEEGEKRTVLIRFHVAADGSIADFQVLQSAGSVFDNEVIRVLKKMPKWTPASKAGQPVSVSFTQPVTFVGIEE